MLNVGDRINLGIYPAKNGTPEPIEWIVLQTDNQKAKIMTKNGLIEYQQFFSEDEDRPWKDSKIRKLLNSEIYDLIFSNAEKKCIIESVTVDDERVLKLFFWDGKAIEDYIGVQSIKPVMTRDYLSLPAMRDLFDYVIIPKHCKNVEWEMTQKNFKNEMFDTDMGHGYPLLDSLYDYDSYNEENTKYKRHMCIGWHGNEYNGIMLWLRPCAWIDVNKYLCISHE